MLDLKENSGEEVFYVEFSKDFNDVGLTLIRDELRQLELVKV